MDLSEEKGPPRRYSVFNKGWQMNLINALVNAITGQNETVLMEFRRRAGGILVGSISRLDRVSASELVVYYQNGRLIGSARIKSTRETLDRYENALIAQSPRIIVHRQTGIVDARRPVREIELDSELN
jgi:hypothetical protein